MENTPHHMVRIAIYGIIIKNHRILLVLRDKTGWMDGKYSLPAGHLEKDETLTQAVIREMKEEVGITVIPTNLTFYHVMHRNQKIAGNNHEYIDFYFKIEYWQGEPANKELHRAKEIKWFDIDALPSNMVPNVQTAIRYYKNKLIYSEYT